MRYNGLSIRDYLILKNISISENSTVLEIGVGTGSTAELIIGKVKKYCGVDISVELIDWLSLEYKDFNSVKFYAVDACSDKNLDDTFDVIFSAHTLEHVKSPKKYFEFIKKHLSPNGIALIVFPNESKEKHHGVSWFNSKKELLNMIYSADLRTSCIYQVKETIYQKLIVKTLWNFPKLIAKYVLKYGDSETSSQSFEKTAAFYINCKSVLLKNVFSYYGYIIKNLLSLLPLYYLSKVEDDICEKELLFYLQNKELDY